MQSTTNTSATTTIHSLINKDGGITYYTGTDPYKKADKAMEGRRDRYNRAISVGDILIVSDAYTNLNIAIALAWSEESLLYVELPNIEYFYEDNTKFWNRDYMSKSKVRRRVIIIDQLQAKNILRKEIDFDGIFTYLRAGKKMGK